MTNKELILQLLECPLEAKVYLIEKDHLEVSHWQIAVIYDQEFNCIELVGRTSK